MGKTILVIDDEALIIDIVTLVLEEVGYVVMSASNGRAALARLRAHPIDLVLSDVMMPSLDGWGLLAVAS